MKLTRRIFILNLLSFVVALVIAFIVFMISMAVSTSINMNNTSTDTLEQSMERQILYAQLETELSQATVEQFADSAWMETLMSRLQQVNSQIAVIHNRNFVVTSMDLTRIDLDTLLKSIGSDKSTIKLSVGKVKYKYVPLSQEQAYLFFIHKDDPMITIWLNIMLSILSFFIVHLIFSWYISRKIANEMVKPIERLKESANQISEGELNSIISAEGNGELLELCKALEQMRIKLKESIHLQQKYDKNRSFLVSSISHDLRTPVTSIKGYIEGILDGVATTPEMQKKYLLTAHRKTVLMTSMIEDLLLYSKLDLKQMPFNKQPIHFVDYIQDGIQESEEWITSKNAELNVQIENIQFPCVLLDGDRFMRVFQNIIDNALHYNNKPQPVITVMMRETYSSLILEVKDNGIGIKSNEADQIFDRFYRSDMARKVETGSGLGLAIAKQIVEAHEGKIWVKSEVNIGTSILISLPKYKGGTNA